MNRPKDLRNQIFTRRSFFLGALSGALSLSLIGRLYYLSGEKGRDYKNLSDRNRTRIHFHVPRRGEILDRYGQVLAKNSQTYRLMVLGEHTSSLQEALAAAKDLGRLEDHELELLENHLRFRPKFLPTVVRQNLSWDEVCSIESHLHLTQGFYIDHGWTRTYPISHAFSHVLGYVRAPCEKERYHNKTYRLTDVQIGKSGVEKHFNQSLEGHAGFESIEVNARGRTVKILQSQKAKSGNNIQLTLDAKLQVFIANRLKCEKSASAVVMDIKTGEVRAMVSQPDYDANVFTRPVSESFWAELNQNAYGIMQNKTIHGLYPPGSLFKMAVCMAALESGVITENFTTQCSGHVDVNQHRFHCWHKRGGHGCVDIKRALSESCDVFFYQIALKLGPEPIIKMAQRLGLGEKTGIELDSEKSGLVPSPDWKKARSRASWRSGDTLNLSIGQGAMLATPLQLCLMMARIASSKGVPTPSLINGNKVGQQENHFNLNHLKIIQAGLNRTVNRPQGLAYRYRIDNPGLEMAGKTATCQVRRITIAERKRGVLRNDQKPWKHRDHALFGGYAPIHDPKFALCVVVEHGGSGGKIAAPIGRDILYFAQTGKSYHKHAQKAQTSDKLTSVTDILGSQKLPCKEGGAW